MDMTGSLRLLLYNKFWLLNLTGIALESQSGNVSWDRPRSLVSSCTFSTHVLVSQISTDTHYTLRLIHTTRYADLPPHPSHYGHLYVHTFGSLWVYRCPATGAAKESSSGLRASASGLHSSPLGRRSSRVPLSSFVPLTSFSTALVAVRSRANAPDAAATCFVMIGGHSNRIATGISPAQWQRWGKASGSSTSKHRPTAQ
jgi:hypothetical protein